MITRAELDRIEDIHKSSCSGQHVHYWECEVIPRLVAEIRRLSPQKRNVILCTECWDIVESTYTHDFKWCKCGMNAVDGGTTYYRRCGDTYVDLEENWNESGL